MEDENNNNDGVVKEGFSVYHTGHVGKPKFPDIKGTIELMAKPQKADILDTWAIVPIPQRAYIYTPPPPPVTHYRLQYTRVDRYFHDV